MILTDQFFQVKITNKNRDWFNDRLLLNNNEKLIIVNVFDLQCGSVQEVKFRCDYCGELGVKPYDKIIRGHKNIKKDCCSKSECKNEKREEVNLHLFGEKSPLKLKSVRDKRDETMISKYGSPYPIQIDRFRKKIENTNLIKYGGKSPVCSSEVQEKIKVTLLDKYGVENVFQLKEIKDKIKCSILEKYGVENLMKSVEIKEKVKNTNLKKYGVQTPFENGEIREKSRKTMNIRYGVDYAMQSKKIKEKAINTMYEHGTQKISKQQKYIGDILGGDINYPVSNISLDIAFIKKSIYVEYDGGGHDLVVKLGTLTKQEFDIKEMKRYYFLKGQGWKSVRIVSKKDMVPSEKNILKMWDLSEIVLKKGNWIVFDIDRGITVTKNGVTDYDFGTLKRL